MEFTTEKYISRTKLHKMKHKTNSPTKTIYFSKKKLANFMGARTFSRRKKRENNPTATKVRIGRSRGSRA